MIIAELLIVAILLNVLFLIYIRREMMNALNQAVADLKAVVDGLVIPVNNSAEIAQVTAALIAITDTLKSKIV